MSVKPIWNFIYKHRSYFLILIPIFLCIFFRAQTFYLPVTDTWAASVLKNNIQSQILDDINSRFPNLPEYKKQELLTEQFLKFKEENIDSYEKEKEMLSQNYRERLQDENGQTYLIAIDSYTWYAKAKNYVKNGYYGDYMNDGYPWFSLRHGRIGQLTGFTGISWIGANFYKFVNFFKPDYTVLSAMFIQPLLFMTLAVIPLYFLLRRLVGDLGALVGSIYYAVEPTLLTRTIAGFSDTDFFSAIWPLFIAWLFVKFVYAEGWKKYLYISLVGLSLTLYNLTWKGYWFMHATLAACFALYFLVLFFNYYKDRTTFADIKNWFFYGTTYVFSATATSLVLFPYFRNQFVPGNIFWPVLKILEPLRFTQYKAVAVESIWPNVLTTVAELGSGSWNFIFNSVGGRIYFALALFGIVLLFLNFNKKAIILGIFFSVWLGATTYAGINSLRFSTLLVPGIAICLGLCAGLLAHHVPRLFAKYLDVSPLGKKVIVFCIFFCCFFLLITPVKGGYYVATHTAPSFNDEWNNLLQKIKTHSDDSIITSWWDFGHWFYAMGERRVTHDGGDQGKRIHWVGLALATSDEEESIDILRMLNCGQEEGFKLLERELGDSYKSIMLLKDIIKLDRDKAEERLCQEGLCEGCITPLDRGPYQPQEEIFKETDCPVPSETILKYTHCDDPLVEFVITSEDMSMKSGVWGHFGTWNFTRGAMYNRVQGTDLDEGIDILMNDFSLSEGEAQDYYYTIQEANPDKWISGWPSYYGDTPAHCPVVGNKTICKANLGGKPLVIEVDLVTMEPIIFIEDQKAKPFSFVYVDQEGVKEKKYNNMRTDFSMLLVPKSKGGFKLHFSHPALANSMFTKLFYFAGYGLDCYNQFDHMITLNGWNVYTYLVKEECLLRKTEKGGEIKWEKSELQSSELETVAVA